MRAKVLIVALIACLAIVRAGAQAPPSHGVLSDPNRFADAHVNGLDAQLHLSDQQKAKLRPLFFAEGQALISILNDRSLQEDQRHRKIQQLHEETRNKVIPLLTPSQLEQFNNAPKMMPQRPQKGSQQT